MMDVEFCSPLTFRDITCRCRRSSGDLTAECRTCGAVVAGRVHLCEVAYGFYCDAHCPACTGAIVLTAEEERAIEENRAKNPEATLKPRAVVPLVERPEPKRRVRCSQLDIVIRREHRVNFDPGSRREILWQLIPEGDAGITIEELLSISPFSFPVLRQTIRFLLRVHAVEIQRCPR